MSHSANATTDNILAIFEDPAWAEVYAACCVDTGEILSTESARGFRDAFAAQNPANARDRLVVRCIRLGPAAISTMAMQLKDRGYTKMDLSYNQLGDHAMLSVKNLVRALPKLRSLVLSGNLVGPAGIAEFAQELATNSTLESLTLGTRDSTARKRFWNNTIESEGVRLLLHGLALKGNHSLTSLSLCNTSLSALAGRYLAAFLREDRTLLHLDVSMNPLTSDGVCVLVSQCSRLRLLDISDTGCRGELIHVPLCEMLQGSRSLAHLNLAHNPWEPRSFRRLAKNLAACESLVSLSLEKTSMDSESITVLADAIIAAPVQSLTELDLSDNQLSHVEAANALSHTIAKSIIQVLRLNRNPLGDVGVVELAGALDPQVCPSPALQDLEICTCRVGTLGASELFARLSNNKSLVCLRLADNFLDESLDISLVESLQCLQELQLSGNRLSHSALQRVAQVCARNLRRARDKEPLALRAEMHRLLFQETKLAVARERVANDERDLSERYAAVERTRKEMEDFRAREHEQQRYLERQIANEQANLEVRKEKLTSTQTELEGLTQHFAELKENLRVELQEKEARLAQLQALAEKLEAEGQQLHEYYEDEERVATERIDQAKRDAAIKRKSAVDTRRRLQDLHNKSLIDPKQ